MERITCRELPGLFQGAANIFGEKKEGLYEMDARMGDEDLGLTMQKGFGALPQLIRNSEAKGDVGRTLMKMGMEMAALVPSTMRTLVLSRIMGGGKAIGKKGEVELGEFTGFLTGFARGIAHHGRCQLGDRTILSTVDARARRTRGAYAEGANVGAILYRAAESAKEGVKATEGMFPKCGKTAMFSAKAKGVPDQGAVAGQYSLGGLGRHFL